MKSMDTCSMETSPENREKAEKTSCSGLGSLILGADGTGSHKVPDVLSSRWPLEALLEGRQGVGNSGMTEQVRAVAPLEDLGSEMIGNVQLSPQTVVRNRTVGGSLLDSPLDGKAENLIMEDGRMLSTTVK